jgi:starvation-inducible DNA-binding protein
VEANEKMIATVRSTMPVLGEASDEATLDLMTQRLHQHSKVAWMLTPNPVSPCSGALGA